MTYRIALVDDQVEITQELASYCQRFATEEKLDVSVLQFNSAEVFLDFFKEFQHGPQAFDLIVFDIEMGQISGMEAARIIRQTDQEVGILFVTSLVQYAIQGYAVDALDFLVKPVSYQAFAFRLQRALRNYQKQQAEAIQLPLGKKTLQVLPTDLLFVEIQGHNLSYYTKDKVYQTQESLKTVESLLASHSFAKPSQSFLVNLAHIEAIRGQEIQIGNYRIPISRAKKQEFLQAFSHYIGGFQ